MLTNQEFDSLLEEASSDYNQRKELRSILLNTAIEPKLIAEVLFRDAEKPEKNTSLLSLFQRLIKERKESARMDLSNGLEKVFQNQKRERISLSSKDIKMYKQNNIKITKPKIDSILYAFDLFEDLNLRYQEDENKKKIASFLTKNKKRAHSILEREKTEKNIAYEDGDYDTLSIIEAQRKEREKNDFFTHSLGNTSYIHTLYHNYRNGAIIETPYVQEKIDEIMESLTGEKPIPVMLIGVHGAGKTELARHVSRTRFGKEAIEIPGSEDLDKRDFEGRYKLEASDLEGFTTFLEQSGIKEIIYNGEKRPVNTGLLSNISTDPILRIAIEDAIISTVTPREGEKADDTAIRYREAIQDIYKSPVTTKFVYGRMAEAMKIGAPFIVDEANALKPAVWLALHSYLVAKPGDTVRVNGDTIQIQKGFCWILTGNPTDQYTKGRNKFDIATMSRIQMIRYNYLPQESEDSFESIQEKGDTNYDLLEENQLFATMLISMMDSPLGLHIPGKENEEIPKGVTDLHNLARLAREVQKRFQKIEINSFIPDITGGTNGNLKTDIKEHTISPREIFGHILPFWKKSQFSQDLDYSLYFHFIDNITDKKEQFEIYFMAQEYGFFQAPGWPNAREIAQNQDAKKEENISNRISRGALEEYEQIKFPGTSHPSIWKLKKEFLPRIHFLSDIQMIEILFREPGKISFEDYVSENPNKTNIDLKVLESKISFLGDQCRILVEGIENIREKIKKDEISTQIITGLEHISGYLEELHEHIVSPTDTSSQEIELLFGKLETAIISLSEIEDIKSDPQFMQTLTNMLEKIQG